MLNNEPEENENNNYLLKERIKQFIEIFKKVDFKLWHHFDKLKVDPKLFVVKWFMVSLS